MNEAHDHNNEIADKLRMLQARKAGLDVRPGRRVTLRVVSRGTHAVAGHLVFAGEQLVRDVHPSDVPEFLQWVDRATPEDLRLVEHELRRRTRAQDEARRSGGIVRSTNATHEAAYAHTLGRQPLPFVSVEVVDGEVPATSPAPPEAPVKRARGA